MFDRPPTHLASSVPFDGRAFALRAAIDPFSSKIICRPRCVARPVDSNSAIRDYFEENASFFCVSQEGDWIHVVKNLGDVKRSNV